MASRAWRQRSRSWSPRPWTSVSCSPLIVAPQPADNRRGNCSCRERRADSCPAGDPIVVPYWYDGADRGPALRGARQVHRRSRKPWRRIKAGPRRVASSRSRARRQIAERDAEILAGVRSDQTTMDPTSHENGRVHGDIASCWKNRSERGPFPPIATMNRRCGGAKHRHGCPRRRTAAVRPLPRLRRRAEGQGVKPPRHCRAFPHHGRSVQANRRLHRRETC
jgi:hypothetical protein